MCETVIFIVWLQLLVCIGNRLQKSMAPVVHGALEHSIGSGPPAGFTKMFPAVDSEVADGEQ